MASLFNQIVCQNKGFCYIHWLANLAKPCPSEYRSLDRQLSHRHWQGSGLRNTVQTITKLEQHKHKIMFDCSAAELFRSSVVGQDRGMKLWGGVVFDGRGWHCEMKGCLKGDALAGGGRVNWIYLDSQTFQ